MSSDTMSIVLWGYDRDSLQEAQRDLKPWMRGVTVREETPEADLGDYVWHATINFETAATMQRFVQDVQASLEQRDASYCVSEAELYAAERRKTDAAVRKALAEGGPTIKNTDQPVTAPRVPRRR